MKKIILLAVFACGFFQLSFAQKPLQLGMHANFNLNSARGSAFSGNKPDMLFGVGFGVDVRYKISDHFSIFATPSLDQNGYAFRSVMLESIPPTGALQEADLLKRMMYINLPVVAAYNFGAHNNFHIGGGGFIGWLAESQVVTKRSDGSKTSASSSANDEKDFNYGLTASAGVAIPLSKYLQLNLSLQDNLGLANINTGNSSVKLNTVSLSTGLICSFK